MAKWYKLNIFLNANTRRTVFARSVAKRDGSLQVGVGMKREHRSCLVLTFRENHCYIDGISSFTKGFAERKNPLRIVQNHLQTWLSIANDLAFQNGCTTLEVFDAANVMAKDHNLQFLSKLTLLKSRQFLYEKYGFVAVDLERANALRDLADQVKQSGITADSNTFHIDEAFELRGADTKAMQLAFTKLVQEPFYNVEVIELERMRKWMRNYTDATLDVY